MDQKNLVDQAYQEDQEDQAYHYPQANRELQVNLGVQEDHHCQEGQLDQVLPLDLGHRLCQVVHLHLSTQEGLELRVNQTHRERHLCQVDLVSLSV